MYAENWHKLCFWIHFFFSLLHFGKSHLNDFCSILASGFLIISITLFNIWLRMRNPFSSLLDNVFLDYCLFTSWPRARNQFLVLNREEIWEDISRRGIPRPEIEKEIWQWAVKWNPNFQSFSYFGHTKLWYIWNLLKKGQRFLWDIPLVRDFFSLLLLSFFICLQDFAMHEHHGTT